MTVTMRSLLHSSVVVGVASCSSLPDRSTVGGGEALDNRDASTRDDDRSEERQSAWREGERRNGSKCWVDG